jgi:hypothetical protein
MLNMNNPQPHDRQSMADRFRQAAEANLDNWRDPQHDLEAIRLANLEERSAIERFLLARGVQQFIDVEALAMLDTPMARQALVAAFESGKPEVRAAVAYLAPYLVQDDLLTDELVRRIGQCDVYDGLNLTLTQIESNHSPLVIHALLQRIARDPGVTAVHFAGLLLYLHKQASEPFDWNHRPFLLRFNPGNEDDRRAAFAELCSRIGQNASDYDAHWV